MDESTPNRILLIGYLEEALPPEEMTRIEDRLRQSEEWRRALVEVRDRIDTGEHSVATIWRRHRLTCPDRERLGAFIFGALGPEEADYIRFHLETIGCRWCASNQADLVASSSSNAAPGNATRRQRFFETSIGSLPR